MGLSDFLRKSLMTLAGALPTSENIMAVLPLSTPVRSPKSLSEASMAFANNVFLTTVSSIPALKQARRKFEVFAASSPETSVK